MISFAELLRELVDERGLRPAEVARRVPCNRAYISRLGSGQQRPSRQIAERLDELLNADGALTAAAGYGRPAVRRLAALSVTQLQELTGFLDQQWHALVKADNLLGSRYALRGVRDQLAVIDELLDSVPSAARSVVLRLGARYAESAAWLCEDAAEIKASRHWAGRATRFAVEGADDLMVAWTLFRRSQQATADGNVGEVGRLTALAWQRSPTMPGPMKAAILQQQAHGHALAGSEVACHRLLDRAMAHAAADDDPGDASAGHGSFCTHGYLEMQRGICWARLNYPDRAIASFELAISSMPPVYRRDRGVALAGQAACLAAVGAPAQAAIVAYQALMTAVESGSGRVLHMVKPVAAALERHERDPAVAGLRAALLRAGSV